MTSVNSSRTFSATLERHPALIRAAPFILFVVLTFAQGWTGETGAYWMYLIKTVIGAGLIWLMRNHVSEMTWRCSGLAVAAGLLVFLIWVGLDGLYPQSRATEEWNPCAQFGAGSVAAWSFIAVRLIGSTLVVPPLEEVFYRSFLYRWIERQDFLSVALGQFLVRSFVISVLVFGFAHREWLAAILCGLIYQGLVCWTKRLGDAIAAHAITNLLLGLWVLSRGEWRFWS